MSTRRGPVPDVSNAENPCSSTALLPAVDGWVHSRQLLLWRVA
jgi:hypothetical protein